MSPSHCARRFPAAYGETAWSYLMTATPVTGPCMEVGCTSLGSFSARSTTEQLPPIEDEYCSFGGPFWSGDSVNHPGRRRA
jgi:hypothetical protein